MPKSAGNLDFLSSSSQNELTHELEITSSDGKWLIRVSQEVIEGIFGEEFLVVLRTTKKPSQIC